jgi:hypothetical protein
LFVIKQFDILSHHVFFADKRVCDNALPATDLVVEPILQSLSKEEALDATTFEVCFELDLVIEFTSSHQCSFVAFPLNCVLFYQKILCFSARLFDQHN